MADKDTTPQVTTNEDGTADVVFAGTGDNALNVNDLGSEAPAKTEIEVVDDTPPEQRGSTDDFAIGEITDTEMKDYTEGAKKRISQLTAKYRAKERAAAALERENNEAAELVKRQQDELKRLTGMLKGGESNYVAVAKHAAQASMANAKAMLKEALETGDAEKIADAQVALSQAAAQASTVAAYQPQAEALEQQLKPLLEPQKRAPAEPVDEIDAPTRAWMGRNPWFNSNIAATNYAVDFARRALEAQGITAEGDPKTYFSEVDKEMARRFPELVQRKPASNGNNSPVVGAGTSSPRSGGGTKVRLTESQVRLAERMGVPLEVYAREYAMRNSA